MEQPKRIAPARETILPILQENKVPTIDNSPHRPTASTLFVAKAVTGVRCRSPGPIQLSNSMFQVVAVTGLPKVPPVTFGVRRRKSASELSQAIEYPPSTP